MNGLLTLFGVAFLVVAISNSPRLWRLLRFPGGSSWPTLQATVEQVLVRSYPGRAGTIYRAEINYSYRVNGDYYAGHYTGDLFSSEAEVDDLVEHFPKGTIVQVHVHPRKPELSVLKA
jgi:hypothetical protein